VRQRGLGCALRTATRTNATVKLRNVFAFLDQKMVVSFLPGFGAFDRTTDNRNTSILETAGQLSSGVVSEAKMKERFQAALKLD
jgi:hypothetical protein